MNDKGMKWKIQGNIYILYLDFNKAFDSLPQYLYDQKGETWTKYKHIWVHFSWLSKYT